MQQVTAEVLSGAAAVARLEAMSRSGDWQELVFDSRSATIFQHPSYVLGWYATHADSYEPLIVLGRTATGRLAGLWLLARERRHSQLVQPGTQQSTVPVGTARPETERTFMAAAQRALAVHLGVAEAEIATVPMPPRRPV